MNHDPEANDQHGPDGIEGTFMAAVCFLGMIPVVAIDMARDWVWRKLHG